jgi:hypothetical protein
MWRDERGMALVLVLLCATLFLALGGSLVTVVSTEATISATFRDGVVALAAADAAVTRVIADLATASDLNAALAGIATSTFIDGAAAVPRRLPDGTVADLVAATNIERCGETACTDTQMDAVTADRPWGANNARWQIYGSGWLRDMTPHAADGPHVYAVVWIGDDPLETDGDPLTDDGDPQAPGHQVVLLRAVAYASYSARRTIEVVARRDDGIVRITSWREIGR